MNFKFATDILRRLGEELIPDPGHGIIELVKNAYDADALQCRVELNGTTADYNGPKNLDRERGRNKIY